MSLEEIRHHLECEYYRNALGYPELIDASGACTTVTANEIRKLVDHLQEYQKHGPFGPTVVVATNDVLFGMVRMLGILLSLRGGPDVEVFRDREAAMEWLQRACPA